MNNSLGVEKALFVSNMGEDSISIIDMKNKRELSKISLLSLGNKPSEIKYMQKKPKIGPHCLKMDHIKKLIYSVNCFDDSICVIDMISFKVNESFFAGSHPNDMVFNSDESYAYITNSDSDSVSIIDIVNKKIVGQISVGVMPHGICISPNGEFVYVANMDSDSISIIDTWSNSKVGHIKVGKCPIGIIPSKDGRFLYVTCSYLGLDKKGSVSIISTSNYKIMKSIEVGSIPVQMELSKYNNYLYVTNMGSNDVYIIDLNRLTIKDVIKAGNMARGIIEDNDGNIFVTNSEDNNISVIKIETGKILHNIEVGIEPTSMLYMDYTIW